MLSVSYRRFGEPVDVLGVSERPIPSPKVGEVLVEVIARPINPSDLIPIRGAYPHRVKLPAQAGYECFGRIVDTNGDVPSTALVNALCSQLREPGVIF